MNDINKVKNDELLEFLMTSDFVEEWTTEELKFMLVKFREFYRYIYSLKNREIDHKDGEIKKMEELTKHLNDKSIEDSNEISELNHTLTKLKNRKLTIGERWSGKLKL